MMPRESIKSTDTDKDMKMEKTKTKTPIPIAVLEGLPRNSDGSINYEDVLFAYNARKAMGIKD